MAKDEEKKDGEKKDGEGKKKPPVGAILKIAAMVLPTVIALGAVVYLVVFGGGSSGESSAVTTVTAEPTVAPSPGEVLAVDSITVNLASGHFLQVAMGLQVTAEVTEAGEELDTSKAIDIAIAQLSNGDMDTLATTEGRDAAKATLVEAISEAYEGKIYDVYFTGFVMQ